MISERIALFIDICILEPSYHDIAATVLLYLKK